MDRAAEGVEVLRLRSPGRIQRTTTIYLLQDGGGVVVYETGSVGAAGAIRRAAADRGGIRRILLSRAHADHRGGAARLEAAIFCHLAERPGAEGDGWAKDGFRARQFSDRRHPAVARTTTR